MVFDVLWRMLGLKGKPAGSPAPAQITVLIHRGHSYAVKLNFMGLHTTLSIEELRLAAAYVLHIWKELPLLESQVVEPLETELIELLCHFYGATPFIGYQPPQVLNAEIELGRLWQGPEAAAVAACPQLLRRVARPGMRRAALNMLLCRVRYNMTVSRSSGTAGRNPSPGTKRDYFFLLGLLRGKVPLDDQGTYLAPADSSAPDLIRLAPVDEAPAPPTH